MQEFWIFGTLWKIFRVPPYSDNLFMEDRHEYTLGTTFPNRKHIYISNALKGEKLKEVVQHELSHAISVTVNYPISFAEDERMAGFNGNYADEINEISEMIINHYK